MTSSPALCRGAFCFLFSVSFGSKRLSCPVERKGQRVADEESYDQYDTDFLDSADQQKVCSEGEEEAVGEVDGKRRGGDKGQHLFNERSGGAQHQTHPALFPMQPKQIKNLNDCISYSLSYQIQCCCGLEL